MGLLYLYLYLYVLPHSHQPEIRQLGVGTDAQGFGVRADCVQLALGVELSTAYSLDIFQRRDGYEPGPSGSTASAVHFCIRSIHRLQKKSEYGS
jgi:hypothetical protein